MDEEAFIDHSKVKMLKNYEHKATILSVVASSGVPELFKQIYNPPTHL